MLCEFQLAPGVMPAVQSSDGLLPPARSVDWSMMSLERNVYLLSGWRYVLTPISLSMASIRSSSALTRARWFSSVFDRFSLALGSGGADALMLSMVAIYSSRVDEIVWKVAAIFHGFVEMYIRGESKTIGHVSNEIEHNS